MAAPDLRDHLTTALAVDLIGPYAEDEVLRLPPSRWYLTGFLVPKEVRDSDEADPTADEEFAAGDDEPEEETAGAEPEPKQKNRLPASLGLSVLVPAGPPTDELTVTLRFAEYIREDREVPGEKKKQVVWKRVARTPGPIAVPLDPARLAAGVRSPEAPGLSLKGKLATAEMPHLAPGTRALSLFVVNERTGGEKGRWDEQYVFQVELTVAFAPGFVARPNLRDTDSTEWDERVADLQFRDRAEYAVGHGVSVAKPAPDATGRVTRVTTTWLPATELPRVVTFEDVAATVVMDDLATLADAAAVHAALDPIVDAYGAWLERQRALPLDGGRAETRDRLVVEAEKARARIAAGIALLADDAEVREAFGLANRAMATQARRRNPAAYAAAPPKWRLFQLAFVLLNLPSIARDDAPDRDTVELIFFPTGGGKTEAYLGVIAFTLILRRLRGQGRPTRGSAWRCSCATRCACSRSISSGARRRWCARSSCSGGRSRCGWATCGSRSGCGSARAPPPTR
jgi:hypothetical protein